MPLVQLNLGKARILLCTIEVREHRSVSEQKRKALWNKLMKAAGAQIADDSMQEERFSTHTPAGQILNNPQAKATVRKFIPMVAMLTEDMIAEISAFSIRELARMYAILLRLSNAKLDQIDQALSKISLESENATSADRDSLNKNARILKGDQIVQVLAAGFFAGSDCASMLNEDFLGGENNANPVPGDEIVQDFFQPSGRFKTPGLMVFI